MMLAHYPNIIPLTKPSLPASIQHLPFFVASKSMLSSEKRFPKQNLRFFWTFAIEYESDNAGSSKDIELETDAQKGIFFSTKGMV